MENIRKSLEKWYIYPIILFLVGAVSYLYQLTQMGFYWDDWQAVLLYQINDPKVISAFFSFDRPFSAWTYQLLFPLLPMKAWVWQLITMVIHGSAILAFVEAFHLLWPKRIWFFNWLGLLLFVAPVFSSQPISVAFNQHFLTLFLFCLSLLLTGLAVKKKRWFWLFLPLALVTTIAHLFTMEYFVGLELVRLIYIFFLISTENNRKWVAFRKTAFVWMPYAVIIAVFVYWRFGLYPAQIEGELPNDPIVVTQLVSAPITGARELITRVANDAFHLLVNIWVNNISPATIDFSSKANLFSWAVGFIVASVVAGLMFINKLFENEISEPDHFYSRGLFLGISALIFGGLPVWLTGRQIIVGKWSDRFSLAPMIGAIIILLILIDWIVRTKLQKHILLAMILGLSISFQMRNVNKYRLDWQVQREYYWQLAWRIPDLQPGTVIYSPTIPNEKLSDYATAFAINVLYGKESMGVNVPYWFITPRYLDHSYLVMNKNQVIQQSIRNIQFIGSTADMVSVYYRSSERCLKVLDSVYQKDPFLNTVDPIFFKVNNYSRILSAEDSVKPSEAVFGKEMPHGWCYYFEKADLARQNKQWDQVVKLMDEASTKSLQAAAGSELLPLLEAYIHLENWEQVINTAKQMISITPAIKPSICTQLTGDVSEGQIDIPQNVLPKIRTSVECD